MIKDKSYFLTIPLWKHLAKIALAVLLIHNMNMNKMTCSSYIRGNISRPKPVIRSLFSHMLNMT